MQLHAENETEQVELGKRLGCAVGSKALITLQGDLGAGKTTLVRGFMQARGHQGNVKSPTYTLIEPYTLPNGNCYHLDLYRLSDGEELEYLGLREMLAEQAVLLIEWPERAQDWLPTADLAISINQADPGRSLDMQAGSQIGQAVLAKL